MVKCLNGYMTSPQWRNAVPQAQIAQCQCPMAQCQCQSKFKIKELNFANALMAQWPNATTPKALCQAPNGPIPMP